MFTFALNTSKHQRKTAYVEAMHKATNKIKNKTKIHTSSDAYTKVKSFDVGHHITNCFNLVNPFFPNLVLTNIYIRYNIDYDTLRV
ncbi:unnamed protein product [Prunus brigantina]